jgi:hypothetical protein
VTEAIVIVSHLPERALPQTASKPMMTSAVLGTILQLIMVVVGHYVPQVASLFPVVGTAIGGVAGLLNGWWSPNASPQNAAGGGAVAGGVGGLIGTIVSHLLGDVPASTLAIGTGASAGAGILGGLIGKYLGGRSAA